LTRAIRSAPSKRKVLERLTDVARHYRALEDAMAVFGAGLCAGWGSSAMSDPVRVMR
jgi:hypothetical protein